MKEKALTRETLLEQRRLLMASLKYASFIQRAVLPDHKYMENILKDFFINHPPASFDILHQGGKETSKYAIGSLKSGPNTFRITFLLKSVNSKVFIHQLRIENANAE